MPRLAAAGALALLLGWAAAHGLSLQWWTLVPWGLAAVALGYRANRATAVIAGALYGFVLCFVFTLASYGGAAPAITRIPFFTVLGLVGALCGSLLATLGASLMSGRRVSVEPPSRDDAAQQALEAGGR